MRINLIALWTSSGLKSISLQPIFVVMNCPVTLSLLKRASLTSRIANDYLIRYATFHELEQTQ